MGDRKKIILIEGTDKSGKQTQSNLLVQRLKQENIPVATMSFPRYDTPTGRIIGQCYLGKENLGQGDTGWFENATKLDPKIASLYFAADRLAAQEEIKTILYDIPQRHLVLDRYVESNIAHQGGKIDNIGQKKRFIKFIRRLEYIELGIRKPEIKVFLHMPHELGIELGKGMDEKPDAHEADKNHLKNAEETYLLLTKEWGWKTVSCAHPKWKPSQTIEDFCLENPDEFPVRSREEIHQDIYDYVIKKI